MPMLSPLLVLTLAAAPVELTIVQSVTAREGLQRSKTAAPKFRSYTEKLGKRTVSTAYLDADGKIHVQCEQRAHGHQDGPSR